MIDIAISNRQSLLDIDADLLTEACRVVVAGQGYRVAEISLVVVDDEEMQALNHRHLGHDYPTDVLSFPLSDAGEPLAGEIIVSTGTAIANAEQYGTRPLEELLLYVVHGALHLVGEGDKTPQAAQVMRAAEARWLTELGLEPTRVEALVYPDRSGIQVGEPKR